MFVFIDQSVDQLLLINAYDNFHINDEETDLTAQCPSVVLVSVISFNHYASELFIRLGKSPLSSDLKKQLG